MVADQDVEPGEEGMAVPQMADALALPAFESFVGGGFRRRRVALQQGQFPALAGQCQRCPEAGYSAANHQNAFAHRHASSICMPSGLQKN